MDIPEWLKRELIGHAISRGAFHEMVKDLRNKLESTMTDEELNERMWMNKS